MSTDNDGLNENGNHQGSFTQGVGGWAEYSVWMTPSKDKVRHDVTVPPNKVIPIIFLPGLMGSNLRMTKKRKDDLKRSDSNAWKPDDINAIQALFGSGYAGWFKEATPAQRQLNFDPNETEVAIYNYSESNARFDPEGELTKESDVHHSNVPDYLSPIPPLLTNGVPPPPAADYLTQQRTVESAAQKARWRGWSEILFKDAYGDILKTMERQLNNMVVNGKVTRYWKGIQRLAMDHPFGQQKNAKPNPLQLVGIDPKEFGAAFVDAKAITEDDLKKISDCWYPVHAMGYNWLESNKVSGIKIAKRITGLINGYKEHKFTCEKVILVTHSMGGLVARALIHPDYGKLNDSVLGVYHGAMPTLGAAGTYKRMRFGFQEKEGGLTGIADSVTAKILGPDGEHATAVIANASAPLELLPSDAYGTGWLKVVGNDGTLRAWPDAKKEEMSPLNSIYTQSQDAWWRLINPDWVNPGKAKILDGKAPIKATFDRIKDAKIFLNSIEKTFHGAAPSQGITYASYCASRNRKAYGDVVFAITGGMDTDDDTLLPPPEEWILLSDDGKKILTVQAGERTLTLTRQSAAEAGDETVPSDRSAQHIIGKCFVHGHNDEDYEHQQSYSDPQVQASTLYSIVQIALTDKWE